MGIGSCTRVYAEADGVAPEEYYGHIQSAGVIFLDVVDSKYRMCSAYFCKSSFFSDDEESGHSLRMHPDADVVFEDPDELQFLFSV